MYTFEKTIDENNQFENANIQFVIPYNDVDLNTLYTQFRRFLEANSFLVGDGMVVVHQDNEAFVGSIEDFDCKCGTNCGCEDSANE